MIGDTSDLDPRDIAAAGEFVLGTLPLAEREAFRRRLLAEPALAAEIARWEAHFEPMTVDIQPVSPSPKDLEGFRKAHLRRARTAGQIARAVAMALPDELRTLLADATLAITDEPAGGAPGGVATGAVVAQAQMRRI